MNRKIAHLHNGITGKTASLYWINALVLLVTISVTMILTGLISQEKYFKSLWHFDVEEWWAYKYMFMFPEKNRQSQVIKPLHKGSFPSDILDSL